MLAFDWETFSIRHPVDWDLGFWNVSILAIIWLGGFSGDLGSQRGLQRTDVSTL